ncbi:MAG: phosphohydrolase [Desulfobulbaceae bacterium]|uniref:Phosphohydrolase n=1 Tax=Candidatus Desulfatifera sulfidica TaxID=2841691 RepID=A0A8J6TDK4_9BACT|nr:phosphohydrolase [Candidatus Desulfatifera sulfidica]
MQCPGQDNRYWSGEDVFEMPCPHCGNILEFFKDDSQRTCKKCGHKALNPKIDFGCASYCPYAEQCLGSVPPELANKLGNLFRDRLTVAVRKQLPGQEAAYQLKVKAADFAEILCRTEEGNTAAVVGAALLHDINGVDEILADLGCEEKLSKQIHELLLLNTPEEDTENQHSKKLLADAHLLAAASEGDLTALGQTCQSESGKKEMEKLHK